MKSALEQLAKMTTVVADTGALDAVKKYGPVDCTTNPSLVLAAFSDPASEALVAREIEACRKQGQSTDEAAATLTVAIGAELTKLVPGRVSTEVDACLSFNAAASVERARDIIADYDRRGINKDRVLIKLAATWEGIQAAQTLQKDGIDCNLTLLFSLAQAVASANAGAYLISPFVGRITDWYKNNTGVKEFAPTEDPGVQSVRQIYDYYKSNDIKTIVMGASFRNIGQIKALAGCDNLTISPGLLDELSQDTGPLPRALHPDGHNAAKPVAVDEPTFRWAMNADPMATEKLAEGIRNFDADHCKLIDLIGQRMSEN